MKRVLSLALSALLVFSMAGCGAKESAEDVVKNAVDSLKNYDTEQITAYWGDSEIGDQAEEDAAIMKAIFGNISYEIVSSQEEKETASVEVKVSNLDMGAVMGDTVSEVFVKLLEGAFSSTGAEMSEEDQNKLFNDTFLEKLNSGEYDTVEKTVTVTLTLVDKKWTMDADNDEFYDELT